MWSLLHNFGQESISLVALSSCCITFWHTSVYVSAPCLGSAFFCHSNMCINTSLVCNGIQNCVFPWDESNCKGTPVVPEHFLILRKSTVLCCVTMSCVLLRNMMHVVSVSVVSHWASLRICCYITQNRQTAPSLTFFSNVSSKSSMYNFIAYW